MACSKWEETGILFSANELADKESRDYGEHLKECDECRSELNRYREEHRRFFTAENLGAAPSEKVDAEILRLCSDPRKRVAAPSLFPALFRKAFVPVALFVIGFFAVGYVMLNVQNADQMKAASVQKAGGTTVAATQTVTNAPSVAQNDSLADSLGDNQNKVNYAKTRGTLSGQEAIPVDLKNK